MKEWTTPEIEVLDLKFTELGNGERKTPDASYFDGKNTWYSYSGTSSLK